MSSGVVEWQQERVQKLTLGCAILDSLLHGGVPVGSLTELVGESTAGKTQLVLQLLLAAQLPASTGGLAGRSLYIHTEGRAALGRLAALAASRFPQLPGACDSVLVANASAGPEQLCDALQQVEALCASPPAGLPPVRLLVLDSIAHPFRDLDMSGRGAGAARAVLLYRVAAQLKALAQTHSLAVVVTNQVTDCVDDGQRHAWEQMTGGGALSTSGRRVQPALGLHWAHSVTTRLFLSRASPPGARAADREVVRRMRVVYAPHLPHDAIRFAVREDGVHGVEVDVDYARDEDWE